MPKLQLIRKEVIYSNQDAGVTITRGEIQGSNLPVAIKEEIFSSLDLANSAIQEGLSMSRLDHPHVVKIYDCWLEQVQSGFQSGFQSVIVVELMESDLYKQLNARTSRKQQWSDDELFDYLQQLVGALCFAQSKGISHRDIKPQNIFCSQDGRTLKIGDFGSAARMLECGYSRQSLVGSPFYLSPQLKIMLAKSYQGGSTDPYNPFKSDVYSLGVLFLYLARLKPPAELMKVASLPQLTVTLLQEIAGYQKICAVLPRMLEVDEQPRCDFLELQNLLNTLVQPASAPSDANYGPGFLSPAILPPVQNPNPPAYPAPLSPSAVPFYPSSYNPNYQGPANYSDQVCQQVGQQSAYQGYPVQMVQPAPEIQRFPISFNHGQTISAYQSSQPSYNQPESAPFSSSALSQMSHTISAQSSAKKCTFCSNPVRLLPVIPPELVLFKTFASSVCSADCLWQFLEIANREPELRCVHCNVHISACQSTIRLRCGHYLRNKDCFFDLILNQTRNLTTVNPLRCPKCSRDIELALLWQFFSQREVSERKNEIYRIACCSCGNFEVTGYLKCSHRICNSHSSYRAECSYCKPSIFDSYF